MKNLRIATKPDYWGNRFEMEINFDRKLISAGHYVFVGVPDIVMTKKEMYILTLKLKENGFLVF